MFKRFAEVILLLKWPVFLLLLLVSVLMGAAVFHLRIDPSVESLFSKKSPEYIYYQSYRQKYGSDEMLAIAMATGDIFTVRNIQILKALTEELGKFKQVERVLSLANALDIQHKFLGVKTVSAFEGKASFAELKSDILANELFVNNLVSRDGKIANILVYLKPSGGRGESQGHLISRLQTFLKGLERRDLQFYIAGAPIEQYEFVKLIRRDQFIFVPLITGLLVLMTLLIYRSFACMLLAMSIVFVTLIWTFATIALIGGELNLVTSLLAPVIMIVSVVNAVHLMNLFFEIRSRHVSLRKCVVLTIDQLGVPCFLTHFTTMLGFISLTFLPTPAIQSFGLYAALGTFYSYVVEMLLTPILFPILPYRMSRRKEDDGHFFNRVLVVYLEKLEFKWKWVILALTVAGIIFSVTGIRRINIDTSLVKQMKPDLPLAVATRFIDENLTGVYSLGFVLKRRDGKPLIDAESLQALDDFKTYLETLPDIVKVNGVMTLIKKINEARENRAEGYRIPANNVLLARYFKGLLESDDPELWNFISRDFKEVRIEARMKSVGTKDGWQVEHAAETWMEEHLADVFDYKLTGSVVLLGQMSQELVGHQMRSFYFAFGSILLVICLLFRSLKMGLLAAIPNIFPILGIYGLMGWLEIELSTTTAMISSIVLGMVVDASIHFMHRFRLEFEHRKHYLQALHHTFRNVGQALFVSTVILAVGFASSLFANFRPTIHFGLFTAAAIVLAFLCTMVILPVCLVLLKPFGPQKLFRAP